MNERLQIIKYVKTPGEGERERFVSSGLLVSARVESHVSVCVYLLNANLFLTWIPRAQSQHDIRALVMPCWHTLTFTLVQTFTTHWFYWACAQWILLSVFMSICTYRHKYMQAVIIQDLSTCAEETPRKYTQTHQACICTCGGHVLNSLRHSQFFLYCMSQLPYRQWLTCSMHGCSQCNTYCAQWTAYHTTHAQGSVQCVCVMCWWSIQIAYQPIELISHFI